MTKRDSNVERLAMPSPEALPEEEALEDPNRQSHVTRSGSAPVEALARDRGSLATAHALQRAVNNELAAPANQIVGYAELLQEDARSYGHSEVVLQLEKISFATKRLCELIDELARSLDTNETSSGEWNPQEAYSTEEAMESWRPPELDPQRSPPPFEKRDGNDGAKKKSAEEVLNILQLALGGEGVRDKSGERESREERELTSASPSTTESILVVDDNELNRNILARQLFREGYAVCTAEGGYEALETIEAHPFDIVLLDIVMPEIDGLDVLRRIRKTKPLSELPVIMVTGRDNTQEIVEALESGANDYVTKPLDLSLVKAQLKTHLALKRALNRV